MSKSKTIKNNKVIKKKNPLAKALRSPLFKPRIKPSGRIYNRKKV